MGLGNKMLRAGWGKRSMSRTVAKDHFPFIGGLMTELTPLEQPAGALIACKNFEPEQRGGYTRVGGYEAFDGRSKISDQPYYTLRAQAVIGTVVEGETLTGATSGASMTAEEVYIIDNGLAPDELFIMTYSVSGGPFQAAEVVNGSGGSIVVATLEEQTNVAPTAELFDSWKNDAEDNYRSTIQPVTGSGPIRGVWIYNDKVYAFRDNAGGTECVMWESSTSGWTQVDLGVKVRFTAGDTEIEEGQTITGGTSGANCVVRRVAVMSGSWSAGNAEGYLITTSVTSGPFSTGEDLEVSAVKVAETDATTAQESQTLPAFGGGGGSPTPGNYRFHNHNFGGHTKTFRMYGVNGDGNAFEFDGQSTPNVFTLIETGMENDAPTHIEEFRNHLFLAFPGGSIQHSGLGDPLSWNPVTGADERNIGDEVTNMHGDRDRALIITARDSTFILYGEARENFRLDRFTEETGAIENSLLRLGKVYYIDDRGVTDLESSERFGNFVANSQSAQVSSRIVDRLRSSTILCSHISRRKQRLRWTFADGTTVVMGLSGLQAIGFTEVQYGQDFSSACSGEITDGSLKVERIFAGHSTNGYVYELDSGSFNFNGDDIEAFLRLSYHYSGTPDNIKHYHRMAFDADTEGFASFQITVDYNYGDEAGVEGKTLSLSPPGGQYDISNWGEFVYGAGAFSRPALQLDSEGYNIGMYIYSKSDTSRPFTLKGATIQWTPRIINRDTEV